MSAADERRSWHIGKEISLPGLVVILGQTIAIVWWLAGLSAGVAQANAANAKLEAKIVSIEVKVDTLTDSMKIPAALNSAKIAVLETNVLNLEQRLRETMNELHTIRTEQARRAPYIPKTPQGR